MRPDKPQPERGDAFVRKLLTVDPDALDVATDEQIERQMDAAGIDVEEGSTAEELVALAERHAGGRETPAPRRSLRPTRKTASAWVAWVAGAAVIVVSATMNRASLVAYFKGETIGPDPDSVSPPDLAQPPAERAAALRDKALVACNAQRWDTCRAKLDEAAAIDPAGESAERIVEARALIAAATSNDDHGPPEGTKPPLKK